VNYAVCADTIVANADSFDTPASGQAGTSAAAVLTAGSTQQILIKSIHLFNTANAKTTLSVFFPSLSVQAYQVLLPANGSAIYTPDDGWKVYDMTGMPASYGVKTDGGSVSGSGPYTLTFAPDGRMVAVYLDGVKQLTANFTISASSLSFTGLTMSSYQNWSIDYSF